MASRDSKRKPLPGVALAAIVAGWLLFTAFGVVMTYAAWTEEGLDWYFAVGPTIGAVIVLFGAVVGLPLIIREQRELRRGKN